MRKNKREGEWFETWFDSKYYHLLYKDRSYLEAENFIKKIASYLEIPKNSKVLDLACGKGRHSRHLNKMGFDVTGVDLSDESIVSARLYENKNLDFYTHDMRKAFRINYFDYIFNLFTSFGYFKNENDDLNVFKSVVKGLKNEGTFVFDFFNANKVIANLVPEEIKVVEGISFKLKRYFDAGFIFKDISFKDKGELFQFQESVRAFTKDDIFRLMKRSGLRPINVFGGYDLSEYITEESDRLLILAKNA